MYTLSPVLCAQKIHYELSNPLNCTPAYDLQHLVCQHTLRVPCALRYSVQASTITPLQYRYGLWSPTCMWCAAYPAPSYAFLRPLRLIVRPCAKLHLGPILPLRIHMSRRTPSASRPYACRS